MQSGGLLLRYVVLVSGLSPLKYLISEHQHIRGPHCIVPVAIARRRLFSLTLAQNRSTANNGPLFGRYNLLPFFPCGLSLAVCRLSVGQPNLLSMH